MINIYSNFYIILYIVKQNYVIRIKYYIFYEINGFGVYSFDLAISTFSVSCGLIVVYTEESKKAYTFQEYGAP